MRNLFSNFFKVGSVLLLSINVCSAESLQKVIISSDQYAYVSLKTKENSWEASKYDIRNKKLLKSDIEFKQNKCYIGFNSINPSGDKIILAGSCEIASAEYPPRYFYRLVIWDKKLNKQIIFFDNAGAFTFSPGGDAIVYAEEIPGERGSPAPPGYKGGVWLYDFNSKAKKQISKMDPPYIDLNWSEHDGNIYITDYRDVVRYNPRTGKSGIVPYKGIYFSPDGKYYVSIGIEEPSHLYRTCDNKQMVEWEKTIINTAKNADRYIYSNFWSKKLNAAVFRIAAIENVVFDIKAGKVIGEFKGFVLGTNSQGTLVAVNPITPDGKWFDQSKVEILNLIELTSKYQSKK